MHEVVGGRTRRDAPVFRGEEYGHFSISPPNVLPAIFPAATVSRFVCVFVFMFVYYVFIFSLHMCCIVVTRWVEIDAYPFTYFPSVL